MQPSRAAYTPHAAAQVRKYARRSCRQSPKLTSASSAVTSAWKPSDDKARVCGFTPGNVRARPPAGRREVLSWCSMRTILQRVSRASVSIGATTVGRIERGFCLLVGFTRSDTPAEVDWMTEKVVGLRVFGDAEGKD